MDDHPPNFVAMIGSTPDASNRLANVWRNVWGVTFESPPAGRRSGIHGRKYTGSRWALQTHIHRVAGADGGSVDDEWRVDGVVAQRRPTRCEPKRPLARSNSSLLRTREPRASCAVLRFPPTIRLPARSPCPLQFVPTFASLCNAPS